MPDFWTHIIGGERLINSLEDEYLKNLIKKNKKVFNFGCQGPDFFFYHNFWPWIKDKKGPEYGHLIHNIDLEELIKAGKDFYYFFNCSELFIAYFYGLISHMIIDKVFHPFINSKTNDSNGHKRLEINLDFYVVKKYSGKKVYYINPANAIELGNILPEEIIFFYLKVFSTFFNKENEECKELINEAYKDMKKVLKIFYAPGVFKYYFLKLLNIILPLDISIYYYPHKIEFSGNYPISESVFEELSQNAFKEWKDLNNSQNFNFDLCE